MNIDKIKRHFLKQCDFLEPPLTVIADSKKI